MDKIMKTEISLSNQWVLFGATSGIIANALFPILIFVPLPGFLEVFFAAMFGVCYSLLGIGIHHFLKQDQPTIFSQIAAVFILISGLLFNIMLMIQMTFKGYLNIFRGQVQTEEEIALLNWITKTVDPVHLGIQFSNDFFTASAMILLSIVMFRHYAFGKIWSFLGGAIAVALVVVKCYSFPMTPGEVGIPYVLGPLISLWFLAVCIKCLLWRKALFSSL